MPPAAGSGSLPDAERFAFLQAVMEKKWLPEEAAKELFGELNNLSGGGELSHYTLFPRADIALISLACAGYRDVG